MTGGARRDPVVDAAATSVVIPAHRADESLRACLASVAACRPPAGEVIVVADGEAPGCAALAAERGARTLVTAGGEGPAVARNLGAREATGAVVLFLDADVVVPPDLVGRVARIFGEEPGLDGVFGSYDAAPAARGAVSAFRNLLHHHVHQTSRPEAFSFWSGCGALRRSVLLESGGFDEGYRRPSVEDIELGARLVRDGRRIRLDRSLQVKHLKRWRLPAMVVADVRDRALPWTALILREKRLPSDLNLRHRHRLSTAAVLALVAALSATPALPRLGPAVAAASFLVLVAANLPFYRLLTALRGPGFLAAAVPLHALHYLCGALGFAAGLARHVATAWVPFRSRRPSAVAEAAKPTTGPGVSDTPELAAAHVAPEP
ncbi:MAG: glycosyltransferase family 2 protein [Thermoanaerobaculia bacterium]